MEGRTTVRAWGEGDRRWFLNAWSTIAVGAEVTGGRTDVVTQELPAGYCPPSHRHSSRDELLIIVRGEVDLSCEGERWLLGPGSVAHIPQGHRHALTVSLAGPADVIFVGSPAGLGCLVADLGTQLAEGEVATATAPDLAALAAAGARHDLVLDDGGGADGYLPAVG